MFEDQIFQDSKKEQKHEMGNLTSRIQKQKEKLES
jgi:hypothetical protein